MVTLTHDSLNQIRGFLETSNKFFRDNSNTKNAAGKSKYVYKRINGLHPEFPDARYDDVVAVIIVDSDTQEILSVSVKDWLLHVISDDA